MSRIVICEKRGEWARAFRGMGFGDRIVETRHLDACSASLARFPGSLTAVEVDQAACQRFAAWLVSTRWRHSRGVHMVMIDRQQTELGWLLRELGVVHVFTGRLDLFCAAPMIRKHLKRNVPAPLSLRDRIWNNLPWSRE